MGFSLPVLPLQIAEGLSAFCTFLGIIIKNVQGKGGLKQLYQKNGTCFSVSGTNHLRMDNTVYYGSRIYIFEL